MHFENQKQQFESSMSEINFFACSSPVIRTERDFKKNSRA